MPIPVLQSVTRPGTHLYLPGVMQPPRLFWGLMALVASLTALAYLPALSAGLVDLDDYQLLVTNTRYQELTPDSLAWMFTTTLQGHYMPLTWLSYWLDHAVGRGDPSVFHLTNILLHATSAALVFTIIWRLLLIWHSGRMAPSLGDKAGQQRGILFAGAAAIAALLWGVHPLRVESVAWVTERRDVLSGVLLLAALLAWLSAAAPRNASTDHGAKPWRSPWYAASIGLLALSLLAKSWGMSFFVILLVLDVFPLRRLAPGITMRRLGGMIAEKAPFIALGVLFAAIASHAQHGVGATRSLADWGVAERVAQAAYGLVFYLWKSLWPSNLAVLYELPDDMNPLAPQYILCYVLVLAAAAAMLALRRTLPGILAGAAIYLVMLSPVLGTHQSGDQFVADRYSYLATIPVAALLAAGLVMLAERWFGAQAEAPAPPEQPLRPPRAAVGVAALSVIIITALFVATWRQTTVWHDSVTLWSHAIAAGAGTSGVHTSYAIALREAGREDESLAHLLKAVELRPDNGRAWFMLGNLMQQRGELPAAEGAFREAAAHMPQAYMAHVNLGSLMMRQGRVEEGVEAFRAAVADLERPRDPRDGEVSRFAYLLLGLALEESGDLEAAHRALLRASEFPELREQAAPHLRALERRLKMGPPPAAR